MGFINKLYCLFFLFAFYSSHGFCQNYPNSNDLKGLTIDTEAPIFKTLSHDGSIFSLKSELKSKKAVLIFCRGEWCPVCNRHLSNIQDSLKYIREKGAIVIAVSPQNPVLLEKMASQIKVEFTLSHNEDYRIKKAYDLTFSLSEKSINRYTVKEILTILG